MFYRMKLGIFLEFFIPHTHSVSLGRKRFNSRLCFLDRLSDARDVKTGYIEITGGCVPILGTTRAVLDNKPVEFLTIKQFQEDRR